MLQLLDVQEPQQSPHGQRGDLEPVLLATEGYGIAAVPLAYNLDIMDAMIDLHANRSRKRRRQRPSASPWRRMHVGDVEQQRRERDIGSRVLARRQQLIAIFADEGRRRFA